MLHIVINPTAGQGYAQRVGKQVLAWLEEKGVVYRVSHTRCIGHATELASEAVECGASTVIAIGGDGTVCETARGIYGTNAALGIIPAGTGNDIVKMLNTPRKPKLALEYILDHPPRRLDAGFINDMLFINACGTGFDVCVLDYAMIAKRYVRGMLPYLWGVLRTIFTYRPVQVTLEVDGEAPITKSLLLIALANGRYMGGGMNVAPHSSPNDGYLDLITVDAMPNWKMPFQLPKLLFGKILTIPGVAYRRCQKLTLAGKQIRINMDGEILPADRVVFQVNPNAILVHW